MNKWFIAIKEKNAENIGDISGIENNIIDSPAGHYFADPFLSRWGDSSFLFFEDYDYQRGRLCVGEISDSLQLQNIRGLHGFHKSHTSFPSVIQIGDSWYMTPEQVLAGKLTVYRASAFPDEWEEYAEVAQGRFDDPILRPVHNGVELWCNQDGDKLRVFFSEDLKHWKLVRSEDQEFARSAGHFIGDIRPCQDSIPTYGRAVVFKRGDKVVGTIEPTWYPGLTGTHTFNVDDKYVVIDGRIKIE